ncbi:WD40 repeat-like protein [Mycena sanguinolenta]|uniref:WD40 repeat-like protein n=1 Tax=Mycena sanguinolenta TaxID=230812 RepID=A0A8H7CJ47_9AGAR|nr:WD40 repeat-like protein [Mycena sanguinolenta]
MPLVCQKCGHSNWVTGVTVPVPSSEIPAPDVSGQRTALAEIQAEITRFRAYSARCISALEEQQHELEAKLNAVVYPVLSLPAKITSRIFVECLPDYDVSPSTGHMPLLLTRLWSSLCIEVVSLHGKPMVSRGTLLRLQTWLSRSRQRPLSLTITDNRRTQVQDLDQLDISSFVHRVWRLRGSLPNDEDIVKNAPLLAKLYWCSGEALLGFTSHTLTTLHVDMDVFFSSLEFISILQQFPSLSDLACWVMLDHNHHPAPLNFPNLSSLRLDWEEPSGMPPIHALELLTLPNLTSLACRFSLEQDVILPFLSRSACVVRELKCELYGDIPQSLEIFPFVETLDIAVIPIADVLEAMDPISDGINTSPLILPKLQHLKISCENEMSSAHYRHILDIVHGRRAHPGTQELRSLHISVESVEFRCLIHDFPPYSPTAAGLRSLAAAGLDLKVEVDGRLVWPTTVA